MWWATCNHVRNLLSPDSFEKNQTFKIESMRILSPDSMQWQEDARLTENRTLSKYYLYPLLHHFYFVAKMGFGRFFAETWIGSKPSFRPADCMNASVDSTYLAGYNIPVNAIFPYCPNVRRSIHINPNSSLTAAAAAYDLQILYGSNGSSLDEGAIKWQQSYGPDPIVKHRNSNIEKEHVRMLNRLRRNYAVSYNSYVYRNNEYGSICGNASTMKATYAFRDKITSYFNTRKSPKSSSALGHLLQMQIQRSYAWYGQYPELLTRWWGSYRKEKRREC